MKFPSGYHAVVMQEKMQPLTDGVERNVFVTHKFNTLTYWNWDKIPSRNDAFLTALDWIDVSEAVSITIDSTPFISTVY